MFAPWRWLKRLRFWQKPTSAESSVDGEPSEEPMISLVFFLREPRYLDRAILAHAINKAWGIDLSSPVANDTEFIAGEDAPYFVSCEHGMFLVHNFPKPYMENREEFAETMREMRRQKAVRDHRAWMSVDFLREGENNVDVEAAYRYIGLLGAELLDEDCLAAFCPETSTMNPYDDGLADRLRGAGARKALEEPELAPVVRVSDDDPRMQAAVATARERWPEFVMAFENREPGDGCLVKAPFSDGEHTEFMWVSVTALENDMIFGNLGSTEK